MHAAQDLNGSPSCLLWHLRMLAHSACKPVEYPNELFEPTWVLKDRKRQAGPFRDGAVWDRYAPDPVQSLEEFSAVISASNGGFCIH